MLYPRLASLGIVALCVLVFAVSLSIVTPLPEVSFTDRAGTVGAILSFFGVFLGFGGILASFGFEIEHPGYFRPRSNYLGRFIIRQVQGESPITSFCGMSALCGCGLFLGFLVLCLAGSVAFLVLPDPHGIDLAQAGLSMIKVLGSLLILGFVVIAPIVLAVRRPIIGGITALVVYGGAVTYCLETTGRPNLVDLLWLGGSLATGGCLIAAGYGIGRLLRRIPFYRSVCPVRATENTV